jgi:hypothetical protein
MVQLISIFVYSLIAFWYVVPRFRKQERAEALTAVLWIHVFRYLAFYIFLAQQDGYPISDALARIVFVGDITGAVIALAAIFLLRRRSVLGIVLSWLLILETFVDMSMGARQRMIETSHAEPRGVWWIVFTFFAPLVLVSLPLLIWQLCTRHKEPLIIFKEIA